MFICAEINFTLGDNIGAEGLNSQVFKAFDPQLEAEIVVKRIPKADFNDEDEYFAESQKLYYVQHPNIVHVKYACKDDDHIYLTMPYYKNGSVNYLMESRFLNVREIIKYGFDFLNGLHFIHTKKLVHFDVKPTNILIDDSNKALLADFGLAKHLDDDGEASPEVMYGKHFVPEFFSPEEMTTASDIYQAGLTLYRMCNGNDVFFTQHASMHANIKAHILTGKFPDRTFFLPHIPKKLRKIIKKSIEVDISKRYDTILEMLNELATVDNSLDVQYSYSQTTHVHKWTCECDNHFKIITATPNSGGFSVSGTKKMKDGGRETNISSLTKNDCHNHAELYSWVEKFFVDNDI
jgi:eukaryotic-like serine/threonine-protein kinase